MGNYKKIPHVPLGIATRRLISIELPSWQLIFRVNVMRDQRGISHLRFVTSETQFSLSHTHTHTHTSGAQIQAWQVHMSV